MQVRNKTNHRLTIVSGPHLQQQLFKQFSPGYFAACNQKHPNETGNIINHVSVIQHASIEQPLDVHQDTGPVGNTKTRRNPSTFKTE